MAQLMPPFMYSATDCGNTWCVNPVTSTTVTYRCVGGSSVLILDPATSIIGMSVW